MLKVNKKKSEPEEFTKYKSKHKIINWDSFTPEIKQVLKQYLLEEQENSCCPYCEIEIHLEDSHIEHIMPKDKFPKLLAEYNNFIACCLEKKICGDSKASKWSELFINPVIEDPEDYFEYDIKTGKIIPIFKEGNRHEKAKYTIDLLNLNDNKSGTNGSERQVVFFNSPDWDNSIPQRWIFANGKSGKINMYGKQSLVMYYTSSDGAKQSKNETAFVNEGEINLYGIESSGVMISGTETLKAQSGFYLNKPINIYSDSSRGVYIAGNISQLTSDAQAIARVHIGKGKNDTAGVDWTDIETNTTTNVKSNGNDPTGAGNTVDTVDGSIGVMYTNADAGAKIQAPDITLEKFARKSIGILATNGKLTVTNGQININGGESNIGITTKKIGTSAGGNIDFTGNIVMGGSNLSTAGGNKDGIGNIGIFATDGKTVNLTGNLITHNAAGKTRDGIGVFAEKGSTVRLKGNADIQLAVGKTGQNTGLYAKGANSIIEVGRKITREKISLMRSKLNY